MSFPEIAAASRVVVSAKGSSDPGLRIFVVAPYGSDAKLTSGILEEAGLRTVVCESIQQVCARAPEGCGACLLSEEALEKASLRLLQKWLGEQPSWSDMPVVLVTRAGEISSLQRHRLSAIMSMGNVTLLERPFRAGTLVSTVEMALRSRERQYQVRELLEQTARDAEALREAARRKDEFLAMLAHELRNPLSSVSHAVMLQREAPYGAADHAWAMDVISRQTEQLTRLVDDLLDVSRITQGKIKLLVEVVDAARILHSSCQTVAGLMESRCHTLHTDFVQGLWLKADATRVEQIVVNLLTNAAKYTPSHGHVWLSACRDEGDVIITVRDSGVGIPKERIAAMFDMFTQGDRTAARSEGGLGIGLPVVKALCELHGGVVTAESAGMGQGSTFTVRLPATPAPEATPGSTKEQVIARRDTRVLVVDDNVDSAHGLERLLRLRGYIVDVVHDGPAALDRALASCPAVVLLDIGLPGMDGFEVARLLRKQAGCADTLLVALTGYGQEEDRARARASGFNEHFVKPVDFNALVQLLHEKTEAAAEQRLVFFAGLGHSPGVSKSHEHEE
ncbi:MAG: response regulator [Verrucomicrobia bacterium]|nr:response regulator [Verrucomicrobiota bacterium]